MSSIPRPDQAAFPTGIAMPNHDEYQYTGCGLTIREWFAGQALVGVLVTDVNDDTRPAEIAGRAVNIADALIARLQQPRL